MSLRITNLKTIVTAPEGPNLVVVKVETSEPGLFGLGCATFTQRHAAVVTAIDEYLRPLVIGKDPSRIEDIWQSAMVHAYWRNGPVMNNALSGLDMALWDIKGKQAGMPVYELLGGKSREAAAVYRHADGGEIEEVEDNVRAYIEQGYRYIRCQIGLYGGKHAKLHSPEGALPGAYFDPNAYARAIPKLFEHMRKTFGYEIELIHDVHERLAPIEAVRLAKNLEPYRLFFLEDALAPEQLEWFRMIRSQCATPIAMGELFVHPQEWLPLVSQGLIDFIRVHISAIGGLSPAIKLAHLCAAHSVRTAWHGPADVSPVGHAASLHLDINMANFGIQEWYGPNNLVRDMFPGMPEVKDGYLYPNAKPGLGVDLDEKLASKYPGKPENPQWTQARLPDGSAARP